MARNSVRGGQNIMSIIKKLLSIFTVKKFDVDDPDSIMTLEEWINDVENQCFTDYDGFGYFSDGQFYYPSKGILYPSNVDCIEEDAKKRGFTHVFWINR